MAMASRSGAGNGTAVLCFLVASLLLASSYVAATATEAAVFYGAGRKMKQTTAAGAAVATKQDTYGSYPYPGTNLPPAYPTVPMPGKN